MSGIWAVLVLLPVIGGYACVTIWTIPRFYSTRESVRRVYFRSAFYGVFLALDALALHIIFFQHPYYGWVLELVSNIARIKGPVEIFGDASRIAILTSSMFLGVAIGHLLNANRLAYLKSDWGIDAMRLIDRVPLSGVFMPLLQRATRAARAWDLYWLKHAIKNNDFERLVFRSALQRKLMMISLSSGKVYVGWAVQTPDPAHERRALRILPLASGYRDQETQKVNLPTSYSKIYKRMADTECNDLDHMELEDFQVVLPTDQIISAHLFDFAVYNRFQSSDSAPPEEGNSSGC